MIARYLSRILRPCIVVPTVALGVSGVELAIADRKYGLFSGGFGQSSAVDTGSELAVFFVGFILAQAAACLLAWRLSAWIGRKSSLAGAMLHFAFLYGGLSLLALTAQYQLHSYFSDAVDFALLSQLGGGSATDALLFAKNEIALALAGLALFLASWWLCAYFVARRIPGTGEARRHRPRWRWIASVWLALVVATIALPQTASDGARGLDRILSWSTVSTAAARASDFDGDGYGLAGQQSDTHPFDSDRHPLALDVPGNGIDEDGFGGDLALVPIHAVLPETRLGGARPHVVIVVFESTRFDVIGKRIDGKPVAPNLEAMVAGGSAVVPNYSHVGFTTESLKSLFGGALTVEKGAPSLFRDLAGSGYRIGVFSGQPEDFGGISEATGMRDNATFYVDAEQLKDKRAFSFAAQGSLLVDEGIILDEFDRVLGTADAWNSPQFVYLNFQTPHFPYHHAAVPLRLVDRPVERGEISAANRDRVERTYWNAVAHADAALGRLIECLKAIGAWEDTVMLVTGDHGEALFENGFIGHGHVINDLQKATFLASNRKLNAGPGPIALSDIRRVLLRQLGAEIPPAARVVPFMHIGPLDRPTAIGMADRASGVVSLRLDRREACFDEGRDCHDYDRLSGARKEIIDRLVARWGSERWAMRSGRKPLP